MSTSTISVLASTGVAGLDEILVGGLPRNRLFLVEGEPGVGKTTFGLEFARAGVRSGERVLYVSLAETRDELESAAASHGWSLEGISILALIAADHPAEDNTLFYPAEVELGETTRKLLDAVERAQPDRVVVDSLSEFRLLSQNAARYRRQIIALKEFFVGRNCTVLFLNDTDQAELLLRSIAHGVLALEQLSPLYGPERRRLRVVKMRGLKFRGGFHDFRIETGRIEVFPRIVMGDGQPDMERDPLPSGVVPLDKLLGGGLDRGETALILGPAGTGKSVIATQYAIAACQRGEHVVFFVFEESLATLFIRSESLGIPLRRFADDGLLHIQHVNPAELSPGEFAHMIREAVEERNARLIVVDSLNGYYQSMPEENFLSVQLHELFSYLRGKSVPVLVTLAQHGMMGENMHVPLDVSYLSDTVILLRYFENKGVIRKAISVVKKRSGLHETTLRELGMGPGGVLIGPPLREFRGILTGSPVYEGSTPMLREGDAPRDR
jgi:circadian clock protein KaiC